METKNLVYYEFTVTSVAGKEHVVRLDELYKAKNAETWMRVKGYKCSRIRKIVTNIGVNTLHTCIQAMDKLED